MAALAMPRNWQEEEGTYSRLLKRCFGRATNEAGFGVVEIQDNLRLGPGSWSHMSALARWDT
jgi:hypothetical protein